MKFSFILNELRLKISHPYELHSSDDVIDIEFSIFFFRKAIDPVGKVPISTNCTLLMTVDMKFSVILNWFWQEITHLYG